MSVSEIGVFNKKHAKNSCPKMLDCNYYLLFLLMSGPVIWNTLKILFTNNDEY